MNLTTRDLAEAVQISQQAVRDYESWGVLPPVKRSAGGHRLYTAAHLHALQATRSMQRAGYTKSDLVAVMQFVLAGDLAEALAIVDHHHARLHRLRGRLTSLIDRLDQRSSLRQSGQLASRTSPLSIAEAARVTQTSPSTLRHWESQGLLTPDRDPANGYRWYQQSHLEHIHLIAEFRALNLPFTLIRHTLESSAASDHVTSYLCEQRAWLEKKSLRCAEATASIWQCIEDTHKSADT